MTRMCNDDKLSYVLSSVIARYITICHKGSYFKMGVVMKYIMVCCSK